MKDGTYAPYRKPNDTPLFIHTQSNHPPNILRNIPMAVNKRVAELSCNRAAFDAAAPAYQQALDSSGYNHKLEYPGESPPAPKRSKRQRHRKVIWFNPPYSKTVKSNVGRTFLKLLAKHFPPGHKLHKIFNKNTVKVSYSCLKNMKSVIQGHNSKVLSRKALPAPNHGCNCRVKDSCPLEGKCLTPATVYKAEVTSNNVTHTYIGMSGGPFKERYNNHKKSFNLERHEKETELSKHVWSLKRNARDFSIRWCVLARSNTHRNSSGSCNLCQAEKLAIVDHRSPNLLNKRSELLSQCRHHSPRKKTTQADKG